MLAVRSNCRPAVTEKSAASTTLAQGAEQPAGGAKLNGLGEKSANCTPAYSGTTHGVVAGTAMGGSAVAVLGEPTVGSPPALPVTTRTPTAPSTMERERATNRDRMTHLREWCAR